MDDVGIVKTADHLGDDPHLPDMGQKLVPQPLPLGGPLHQAGDIHELHRGGDGTFGLKQGREL
jgi:hypothetical protein